MNAPLYTMEILRLAASLEAPHALEREDGRAELRSPTCGSRIATTIELTPDGKIAAMSQQVHACAFGQASAAILQKSTKGRSREEIKAGLTELTGWLDGSDKEPHWPGLSALAPARSRKSRHGAILLPFRTLLAAMER
jgi:NifU-like protein involved in Fe-S cluster formation